MGFPGLWTLLPEDQRTESRKEDPGESQGLEEPQRGVSVSVSTAWMRSPGPQVPPLSRHFFSVVSPGSVLRGGDAEINVIVVPSRDSQSGWPRQP